MIKICEQEDFMADIQAFQERLRDVLRLARTNGKKITREGIDYFFAEENLKPEQMENIYEYLKLQGISVDGEKAASAAEEQQEVIPLSPEEEEYVRIYEESLADIAPVHESERSELFARLSQGDENAQKRLTEIYLPEVVRAAKELHTRQDVLVEDMIQEGNMQLFLTLGEWIPREDSHGWLCAEIRSGIRKMLKEQAQQRSEDESLVEKVRRLERAVRELAGDEEIKFSVEELSAYLDMEVEEIQDILRLAGEEQ